MESKSKKIASLFIGAGFSFCLANQKLTKDFSARLQDKFVEFCEHKILERSEEQNFFQWLQSFRSNFDNSWDFEILADNLRHLKAIVDHKYPTKVSTKSIEETMNLINTLLCQEYLDFQLNSTRIMQFKKLIQTLF